MHKRNAMRRDEFCISSLPSLSEAEIENWYFATTCFKKDLQSALMGEAYRYSSVSQQAALCATSVLLMTLSFCYIEARTFEEAWPLAKSRPEDLQWIRMSNGKLSTQALTTALATDKVFGPLVVIDDDDQRKFPLSGVALPVIDDESLLELEKLVGCEVQHLIRIAASSCMLTVIFGFWSFIGSMSVEFEQRLRQKEPAALLVLVYWYAKLNPLPVWWLKARTSLEGHAICAYLGRHHGCDPKVRRALRWPVSVFSGLIKG
jgi:hypothetical protein